MKTISREIIAGIAMAACLSSGSVFANELASTNVLDIHSTTFDGPPTPDGNFIPAITGTNVSFTSVGTANGGDTLTGKGIVEYDGTTLKLTTIRLPDLDVVVNPGLATETHVSTTGATLSLGSPKLDTEGNAAGSGVFQVDGGTDNIADFSDFTNVITACTNAAGTGVGALCSLINTLDLDGYKYQIDGLVTVGGGDVITISWQSISNDSIVQVQVVTEPATVVEAANIASADVMDIHSTTFDGPPTPNGNFIPDITGSNVTFTNVGTANGGSTATGTGIVEFDGTTLKLTSVRLPDLDVVVNPGLATETHVSTTGATLSLESPKLDTEGNAAGSGVFQVDGVTDRLVDFSDFTDVITACTNAAGTGVGALCSLINTLDLDGYKFQIDGNLTAEGGDTLVITWQSISNDSIVKVEVVTEVVAAESNVPVPFFAILIMSALMAGVVFVQGKFKRK